MKTWDFQVKSNPVKTSKKLSSVLGSKNGFVFSMDNDKNNSVIFKVRKRILFTWYMAFQNWTIVNGKIAKVDTENKTNVEISFNQHFLVKLIIFTHFFMGLLIGVISGTSGSTPMYMVGGLVLALGAILWIATQNKFKKDIQDYKALISGILEA